MSYTQILALGGLAGLLFSLAGFGMLWLAVRMARSEFRGKGFLRPPSGTRWLRFLLWKQYEYFENPNTRFLFGATHFCMMGAVIVLTGMAALIGTDVLLTGSSGLSLNMLRDLPSLLSPK